MNGEWPRAAIIGGCVADVSLCPVEPAVFDAHSTPLEAIALQPGGDALNEAVTLARLGHSPALVSKLGRDDVGDMLLRYMKDGGVHTDGVVLEEGLQTAINVVLVRPDGGRSFITNRNGSLRRLSLEDILPALDAPWFDRVEVACLASLFVSPALPLRDVEALFDRLKARDIVLCADTTRPKNGETLNQAAGALSRLDYFFPNQAEGARITGREAPEAIVDALLGCGVGCVALKLGGEGCLLGRGRERWRVPAFPAKRCVDTTGAGDTFAAGFIAGLLEGRPLPECAKMACAAASLCVECVGAVSADITPEKVMERMGERGLPADAASLDG